MPPLSRRRLLSASAALALVAGSGVVRAADKKPLPPRRVTGALDRTDSPFLIGTDRGAITSLRYRTDDFDTDYIASGQGLGEIELGWRAGEGEWEGFASALSDPCESQLAPDRHIRSYRLAAHGMPALEVEIALSLHGEALHWDMRFTSLADSPVTIGDLALPLPMHTDFHAGQPAHAAVMKHSFISGHGSHIFWMRSNSAGPYLTMLPTGNTALEFWDHYDGSGQDRPYRAYIHSQLAGADAQAHGCNWRLPHSALVLQPGETRSYGFRFGWCTDYEAVRQAFADHGLIDVEIAPGMTLPSDMTALIALRSSERVLAVQAEYPGETVIEPVSEAGGTQIYRLRFRRLGENRLALEQAGGRRTWLEFFVTEPVETLIAKRGAFIARHQHRDPSKWYNGLLAEYNMENGALLGPDNYDRIEGWRIYEVTCDDPGLSKPAFLAAKNADYPVAEEVAALDSYIHHFVWGGLQRSTEESWSYGIYGIPDWKQNRESTDQGPKGRMHIWRPYDYPHLFLMYYSMYRVARDHPQIATRLPAQDYLERAGQTAVAMFEIPEGVIGWSAYGTGFYNELVIPEIVEALQTEGKETLAGRLRGHWEKKVRFFINDNPDLFGSEYPFDSTGFESTQALARYALDHAGEALGVRHADAQRFADRQIAANLFCRGWLEPAYYTLGSDYRAQGSDAYLLSYMAQMGGWAVLDHALHDSARPHALLRLGAASSLSSWALLNSGTPQSDYGYWYPGEANDGGAGGGFEPAPYGKTWLEQPHHRGSWYYACEIDLGFCGALRAATCLLSDDPVFGRIAMAGDLSPGQGRNRVIPRDGVRRRFHARLTGGTLDLHMQTDRFARDMPIAVSDDCAEVSLTLESDNPAPHEAVLHIGGEGHWQVDNNAARIERSSFGSVLYLPLSGDTGHFTLRRLA
ncbi:hypothetical protein D6851_14035 [Altericroceibacterium spongiae]|uniref:Uncharacterized protein n=1 Tax=Altericroceibacterium spongiae TaxID=2320269 RepID=A0A420EE33_9SPHN|nr:DUF5695 domain-containing protein [Altericroceibacterium spongiae]RKF18916.1 hypothetical protein D6851_14035 [Altericroceibacterium spongiae]